MNKDIHYNLKVHVVGMFCILLDFFKEMEEMVVFHVICLLWVKC
jgi:hypothetical protein